MVEGFVDVEGIEATAERGVREPAQHRQSGDDEDEVDEVEMCEVFVGELDEVVKEDFYGVQTMGVE